MAFRFDHPDHGVRREAGASQTESLHASGPTARHVDLESKRTALKNRLANRWWWSLTLVPFLAGAWYSSFLASARAEVQQELATLRAMGVAVESSQVQALVPKFEGENAAPYYLAAIEAYGSVVLTEKQSEALAMLRGPAMSADEEAQAVKAIRKMNLVLGPLERATELKGCDFQRQWQLGFDMVSFDFERMRRLGSLLAARSRIAAQRGEAVVAVRDIERMHALAGHVAADPTSLAFLVSAGIRARAAEASKVVAEVFKDDLNALQALAAIDRGAGLNVEHALSAELPAFMDAVERFGERINTSEYGIQGESEEIRALGVLFEQETVRLGAQKKLLDWHERALEIVREKGSLLEMHEKLSELGRRHALDRSPSGKLAERFRGFYSGLSQTALRTEAMRRLEQVGLRLMIERAKGRSFPEKLPDWGEVTIDPFTNQPLGYHRTERGFVVLSVGPFFDFEPPRGGRYEPTPPSIAWEFPAKVKKSPAGP